jgi:ParB-like nuclease family protein
MVKPSDRHHVRKSARDVVVARGASDVGENASSDAAICASSAASESASPNAARVLNLRIEYRSPALLRPAAHNARRHSKKQLAQIAKSIERFGFVSPVLISDDFEIVAGHARVEAAKILGLEEVPTARLSCLSPAERRAYVIADNRLAELAGWDCDVLAAELKGLLDLQFDDVELTGFALGDIDHILDDAGANKVQKTRPEDNRLTNGREGAVVSRAGDEWLLGPHRLVCGEAALVDCDVVVRHWQQLTGDAARLAGSDLTFTTAMRLAREGASTASRQGRV